MKKRAMDTPGIDDRLELLFQHAGLSEKQAKLYRLLLMDGETRPSTLSKKSGIKRGNVYALLKDLKFRGLVTEFEKEKVIYVRPEPPERLQSLIDARVRDASIAQELAQGMLTSLTRQYHLTIGKPTIRYFEGEEGLREVFADIYAPKKEAVYGCVDLETANQAFPQHIARDLIPLRVRRKLFAYSLVADSPPARKIATQDKKQLRKTVLVDKKSFPLPAEIDVYEDKIAMLSFKKGEFIGIIIQNDAFAQSLKSVFKRNFRTKPDAEDPSVHGPSQGRASSA